MQTKRWLREQVIRLECRVEALENIVCPGGDHDWFEEDSWNAGEDSDHDTVCQLRCVRCGKMRIKTYNEDRSGHYSIQMPEAVHGRTVSQE